MKRYWNQWFYKDEEVPVYTHLAIIYDHVMDHVDYGGWANFIAKLFDIFGEDVKRVVDGGCGTGILLQVLKRMGYGVTGFDRSIEMLRVAKKRDKIPFWIGDLRAISLKSAWDAFLCLYDTIQYLRLPEIQTTLVDVRSILKRGGLFIFDMVTQNHLLKCWDNYIEKLSGDGWEMIRRSWYRKKTGTQHTEFEIFNSQERKVYREHHVQYIYPLNTLERLCKECGYKILGHFQGFTLQAGDEESDRVHFVIQKEAS